MATVHSALAAVARRGHADCLAVLAESSSHPARPLPHVRVQSDGECQWNLSRVRGAYLMVLFYRALAASCLGLIALFILLGIGLFVLLWSDSLLSGDSAFRLRIAWVLSSLFCSHYVSSAYVLRRRLTMDTETRCRKCDYILRGISEPRCPECGERI